MLTIMTLCALLMLAYKKNWLINISTISMLIILYLLNYNESIFPSSSSLNLCFDLTSLSLSILTLWISNLMVMASGSIIKNKIYIKEFLILTNLMTLMLIITFMTWNLMMFYFTFEIILIPMVLLIMGFGYQPERLQASIYLLFYTLFGSLPLFLILLFSYYSNSSLNFFYMGLMNLNFNIILWWLFLLAFLVKLPTFILHLWLPKAHVEAPVSGSMILAALLLKLGSYGIYRIIPFLIKKFILMSNYIFSLGLIGGLMAAVMCLLQTDMKMLVAYSSISHMGLLLSGVSSNFSFGLNGVVMMMVAHGLTSSGLFLIVNIIYERSHSRNLLLAKGLMKINPKLMLFLFMMSISNMAAPPFINLASELMLGINAILWSFSTIIPLGLMFFISAAYSLYLFSSISHGKSWMNWGQSNINNMEYLALSLHVIPLFLIIMKLEMIY